jgi:molybdate transport system regulatory protein
LGWFRQKEFVMNLSMRNQLPGVVTAVVPGEVMATVKVRVVGGWEMTAAVTVEAVEALGVSAGSDVQVLVKSTQVALATGAVGGVSIRNRIPGTVQSVTAGRAMTSVKLAVEGGELTAVITKDAADELGLAAGSSVTALVKATEVVLATG